MSRFFNTKEVAGTLRLSEAVVRRYLKSGKLNGKRIGRSWLIPAESLRDLLQTDKYSPLF